MDLTACLFLTLEVVGAMIVQCWAIRCILGPLVRGVDGEHDATYQDSVKTRVRENVNFKIPLRIPFDKNTADAALSCNALVRFLDVRLFRDVGCHVCVKVFEIRLFHGVGEVHHRWLW